MPALPELQFDISLYLPLGKLISLGISVHLLDHYIYPLQSTQGGTPGTGIFGIIWGSKNERT
jgi:hypothetical protein